MGTRMARLTVAKCKAVTKPGRYGDGGTLYLLVKPGGRKYWVQRVYVRAAGKVEDIGLGPFPLVTLAEARETAFENRRANRQGADLLATKHQDAKVPTFRQAADATRKTLLPGWKNPQTPKIWDGNLGADVFPIIGNVRVDKVTRDHVLRIVGRKWTTAPSVAKRSLQFMRQVFAWAVSKGFVDANVADMVKGALGAQPRGEHQPALPWREVPQAFGQIEASDKMNVAAKACLRFQILTAVRPGEAIGATWDEIDLDAKEWRIPDARMKENVVLVVPLSDAALAVLEQARPLGGGSGFVFPSPTIPGQAVSLDRSRKFIQNDLGLRDKDGRKATLHGFRDSFGEWTQDTDRPQDVADACLAHKQPGVRAAYFRSGMVKRRRLLMEQWAAFVTGSEERGKVVSIGAGR